MKEVDVKAGPVTLKAFVEIPKEAAGLVIFVHGSGSSRFSPRNQYVAKVFNKAGLATLLMDLLSEEEELIDTQTRELRFDINMLSKRVEDATDWLLQNKETKDFSIGYIGSSTGAAAALVAAAVKKNVVKAVVSRGGRPDLAGPALKEVKASTLMIVGAKDIGVIELNEEAMAAMKAKTHLELVPNATHLFEEPGTLEAAALLAKDWFLKYL